MRRRAWPDRCRDTPKWPACGHRDRPCRFGGDFGGCGRPNAMSVRATARVRFLGPSLRRARSSIHVRSVRDASRRVCRRGRCAGPLRPVRRRRSHRPHRVNTTLRVRPLRPASSSTCGCRRAGRPQSCRPNRSVVPARPGRRPWPVCGQCIRKRRRRPSRRCRVCRHRLSSGTRCSAGLVAVRGNPPQSIATPPCRGPFLRAPHDIPPVR